MYWYAALAITVHVTLFYASIQHFFNFMASQLGNTLCYPFFSFQKNVL